MTKILAIETSCDETAVCVIDGQGDTQSASFTVLGDSLYSQAALHSPYGGVYPTLAKREHQGNLVPLTESALTEAGMLIKEEGVAKVSEDAFSDIRDADFKTRVKEFVETYRRPDIDMIAVTHGPGLEPALWTGINFATAIGAAWGIPVMGIDHMEGHIMSALLNQEDTTRYTIQNVPLPLLALLISGGHTEFVSMDEWFLYERIGETKDDAVGEAFDKVARLLELSYPGGPRIAELATRSRERNKNEIIFPRPMITDTTCDFSFSGLKTAVLYKLQSIDNISEEDKEHVAHAFEDAVRDVLVSKTRRALSERAPKALLIGGGVSANTEIRNALEDLVKKEFNGIPLYMPAHHLTGDNAIMVAVAGYLRHASGRAPQQTLSALGNLRLS